MTDLRRLYGEQKPAMGFATSLISYTHRGPWGKSDFHGNIDGHLVWSCIDTWCPPDGVVIDPMEGSGTTRELVRDLNDTEGWGYSLEYHGYDLSRGDDMTLPATYGKIAGDLRDSAADLIFWHPPYWRMVKYSSDPNDLSVMEYGRFQREMRFILNSLGALLRNEHSRICVVIADYRKDGVYYPIISDCFNSAVMPRFVQLDGIIIREQKGVSSDTIQYTTRSPLVRIMHEYVYVFKPR